MSFPRYPNYKPSGVEWLGEVPEHWEVKRLRTVADLNPSKSELMHLRRDSLVSFLPMAAIGDDGTLNLENEKIVAELENGYTFFRNGDVTIAKITPCYENGKGALMKGLVNGFGFGTTELIVARPRPDKIIGEYLHCLFVSAEFRDIGESHMYGAGGQKRVPDEFVRNFVCGFPPLSEQALIAAFLDRETAKIDALVAEQQRLIELLKEKRQAVISHAVTKGLDPTVPMKPSGIEWLGDIPAHWSAIQIGKVCHKVADGPHFSPDYVEEGVPFLSARNIRVNEFSLEDVKYISVSDCDEFDRRVIPQNGDVLYTKGGTTGIARVADFTERFQVWVHIAVLKLKRVMADPYFVAFSLNSIPCYEQSQLLTRGATNNDLGLTRMIKIWFVLPPLDEQVGIVRFLDDATAKLDTLTAEAERAIELLQERRTALISAAVTGQIDVRQLAQGVAA